ncbi:hypothetical protein DUI87_18269 [Hirundo rustica rustica]|uniref:Uncharacterized protein n=1 Tax=Hirundo rustica rustica TaxID=333673 RepID=A0A3M0KD40_HIRRU|nr:hypothetical protein DUI87_18269 [Hirundo rustica rustica]
MLVPVLLFIKDLAHGTELNLSNSTDDSKLEGEVDRTDGSAVIQRDFNGLEKLDLLHVCSKAGVSGRDKSEKQKKPQDQKKRRSSAAEQLHEKQ